MAQLPTLPADPSGEFWGVLGTTEANVVTVAIDQGGLIEDSEGLARRIESALLPAGAATARELARQLDCTRSEVNVVLYSRVDRFEKIEESPPRWQLNSCRAELLGDALTTRSLSSRQPVGRRRARPDGFVPLRRWQAEALEAWRGSGSRGIVEAVTGTGKTLVGLAAIAEQVAIGGKALVLVPTRELLYQWQRAAQDALPGVPIGLLGDGHKDSLHTKAVVIATVQTAHKHSFHPPTGSVLVADECHRYATDVFSSALSPAFGLRLALSATYERNDGAHRRLLEPYFGSVVFRMGYRQAVAEEVTAHYKVALVAVPLTAWERTSYDELSREVSDGLDGLKRVVKDDTESFAAYLKLVNSIAEDSANPLCHRVRPLLGQFNKGTNGRRQLLAGAEAKMRSLWGLSQAIERADKTLIFTQTISTAKEVAGIVSAAGPRAAAAHSKLKPAERAAVLAAFGAGELDVLVAPRILDEGIDVPAADLGIIVSASRTRRQMIQRMGRVLRRKGDGRLARFVILYVEHTIEDPKRGTHEEFLEEVTGPAEAVQAFSVGAPLAAIVAYLDDFENPAGQPPALMEGDAPTTLVVSPVDLVEYTGPFEDPCFMLAGDSVRVELAAKVAALSDERRQLWELLEFVLRLTCESERPKLLPSWSEATRAVFRFEDDEDDDDVESLADLFDLVYETLNLFDFDNRTTLWKAFLAAHPESEATEFAAFLESLPALLDLEIEDACWVVEFGSATRAAHGGLDVALGPEP